MVKKEVIENFEVYKRGVKRLQQLEKELKSLNTKGHKSDETKIRKKLKNVSLIPEIEEDLRILKLKIAGVDVEAQKSRIDNSQEKRLAKLTRQEKEDQYKIPKIVRKVLFLRDEVEKAERTAKRKQLTGKELKNVKDLPSFKKKINILKNEALFLEQDLKKAKRKQLTGKEVKNVHALPSLKRRLSIMHKEVEKAERTAKRKQLSRQEVKEVKKLPSIKRRLHVIENELERPELYSKRKIMKKRIVEHFEDYRGGVARLRKLRKELNSLDTNGYKKYEKQIRKKLEDVSLIPEIEHDMKELKLRIAGVDVDYEKSLIDTKQDRRLTRLGRLEREDRTNIPKLKGKVISLNREIDKLAKEVTKAERDAKKGKLTEGELETIGDIPYLKERLIDLKITVERVKGLTKKNKLTKTEVQDVKNLPSLEKHIVGLKKDIKKLQGKIKNYSTLSKRIGVLKRVVRGEDKKIKEESGKLIDVKGRVIGLKKTYDSKTTNLKNEIIRAKKLAKRKQLTEDEVKHVEKIPELQRRITFLKDKFKEESENLEKELEDLPKTKANVSYIRGRLVSTRADVKKQSKSIPKIQARIGALRKSMDNTTSRLEKEIVIARRAANRRQLAHRIGELEKKEAEDKLQIHEKMLKEVAESRRMLELEKEDLRNQILDILAQSKQEIGEHSSNAIARLSNELEVSRKALQQEKEEMKERIETEVEDLKEKANKDKEDLYNKLVEKILQLKKQIEDQPDDGEEKENLMEDLEVLKKKVGESRKQINDQLFRELASLRKEVASRPKKSKSQTMSLSKMFKKSRKEKLEKQKTEEPETLGLPELPELDDLHGLGFPDMPKEKVIELHEIKKEIIASDVHSGKSKKLGKKASVQKPAKSKTIFLEIGDFKNVEIEMDKLEARSKEMEKRVKKSVDRKLKDEEGMSNVLESAEKLKSDLHKINETLFRNMAS